MKRETGLKKVLSIAAALMLLTVPVMAQTDSKTEAPVEGTVVVIAGIYDGVEYLPVEGYLIIPPLACSPN